MFKIIQEALRYFFTNKTIPTPQDIGVKEEKYLKNKGNLFVTLYKNGKIVGSSGNITSIGENIAQELIANTIIAIQDRRFEEIKLEDIAKLKIRVDVITSRDPLQGDIKNMNPAKSGVLVIKKDYSKLSVVLPNISSTIVSGKDYITVLSNKLEEPYTPENFITYELKTHIESNY